MIIPKITAIILAAGESKRMGQPKMLLPWGDSTILKTVIHTVYSAGVENILVITGGDREQVEAQVGESAQAYFNPNYKEGGMMSSVQHGIMKIKAGAEAALICLGDQPQIREGTVRDVCEAHRKHPAKIIAPSYHMRRGHPWLVPRSFWDEILHMKTPATMRNFLAKHAEHIHHVAVDTPSVTADLDTKEDYLKAKP